MMGKSMVRYKKLGYVDLNVSDLSRSRHFYENIVGLEYVGQGPEGAILLRCSDDPYNVALRQAAEPGHKRTGWMLESPAQFDVLASQLRAHDTPFEVLSKGECSERGLLNAIRIVEPNTGAVVEFYINNPPDGHYGFNATLAKIVRLGHVVYATPKFNEAVAFYRDVLNFAESDSIEGTFTFMRCWPLASAEEKRTYTTTPTSWFLKLTILAVPFIASTERARQLSTGRGGIRHPAAPFCIFLIRTG
jgi:2,3-dihydroxy-p-cumate/2,3-dihydroxybenzoate 3,4-dioxygenase